MIKLLSVLLLTTSYSLAHVKTDTLNNILKAKKLRVGTTFDYPPFSYKDASGKILGSDITMAKDLARSLGVKVVFIKTTWSELIKDLNSGKFDIAVGGISITLKRLRHAYFSIPYLETGKSVISRCKDKEKYTSLNEIDQKGIRIVVNPGGTNEKYVQKNIKKAHIIKHEDNTTIFTEIINNKADLMITDSAEIKFQETKHKGLLCGTLKSPLTKDSFGYLLPTDSHFKYYVDTWLRQSSLKLKLF